jgi:lipopolysaccharide heptosyltransferase II
VNIKLIKSLDAVIGSIAASLLPSPESRELTYPISSILLIRPGGIGDAVLLAPAIHALRKTYPDIHITVLAERRNSGVFALIPGIDKLLFYDRPRELLQALRCRYDVVIDTEQWHRLSAVVARCASAHVRIGFATNQRKRMFTHTVAYSHDDYEALSFAHLLEPLAIECSSVHQVAPFLSVPRAAVLKASELLQSMEQRPFVVIFPGASISERQWGWERFRSVADRLSDHGFGIVVLGGKEDRAQAEMITHGRSWLNLAGLTSLQGTAAVIQKSALLVSGDSGVLHIAVGLGIPTVSLFGPGRSKKWAPQGVNHIVLNKEIDCSPCTTFGTTPACPTNAQCLRDIGVDEVSNAAVTLLHRLNGA